MRSLIGRLSPSRSDPAPSRWSWRMQRLMLTPAFRFSLRFGLPLALVVGAITAWLSDPAHRAEVAAFVSETRAALEERPEFMVQMMAIDGAGDALATQVRAAVPIDFPVSSFDLDLSQIRATIAALDPVRAAGVRIRPGGVLQIEIEPRVPAVIWRTRTGLTLLDEGGARVGPLALRALRPDLPLIAGEGADKEVPEALELAGAALPLGGRLRGIVRMGQRRWDIVLDRDQRILLPEIAPLQALERVIAMEGAQDVLSRDVARVDMRLSARPTVQMNENASKDWWQIRQDLGQ
ncbi:cell division protein FtsQ/DivIB [Sulfitobacter sp. D35]|uniref:cell division protein FtsQ/DivIB n=1 Tax=Sulfitobacter sp. D35 TaxID=3083252 RepID=UPI00296E301D|nr:cell division protein FtsQ/DivIB [Sulfitobacter sp. D35]MDW4497460.1 cell division protein FtsQ/DivIB [Sulfitobacter sp. D35]